MRRSRTGAAVIREAGLDMIESSERRRDCVGASWMHWSQAHATILGEMARPKMKYAW